MNLTLFFILCYEYSRERTLLCDFFKRKKASEIGLYLQTDFFQTWFDMETAKLYILIPVWVTLTYDLGHS